MSAQLEIKMGYYYGWDLGETEWKTGYDFNIVKMGALHSITIIDRDLPDPPGAPSEGDMYIPAATATGAWLGHENDIAYYHGGAWIFYTPNLGWRCTLEDEDNGIYWFDGTDWTPDYAMAEGTDVLIGTTIGTKIGTAGNQKLAFWGESPVIQPASAGQVAYTPGNSDADIGGLTIGAIYGQAEVQALRDATEIVADDMRGNNALLLEIRTALVNCGIIKGSA